MMCKEFLKKASIVAISLGLIASPLAFATEEPEHDPEAPEQQAPTDPATDDPTEITEPAQGADPTTPGSDMDDPGLPDEDEAGFGDGGEAMPQESPDDPPADPVTE